MQNSDVLAQFLESHERRFEGTVHVKRAQMKLCSHRGHQALAYFFKYEDREANNEDIR